MPLDLNHAYVQAKRFREGEHHWEEVANTFDAALAELETTRAVVADLLAEAGRLRAAMPQPAALNLVANWLDKFWRRGSACAFKLREMAETISAALEGKPSPLSDEAIRRLEAELEGKQP